MSFGDFWIVMSVYFVRITQKLRLLNLNLLSNPVGKILKMVTHQKYNY